MTEIGKTLADIGAVLLIAGFVLWLLGRLGFPIVTAVVLSQALSIGSTALAWPWQWIHRR